MIKCIIPLLPIPISEHYTNESHGDSPRYPIDIYQCLDCGAVQTNDDIDPDYLWKDYTYYSGHTKKIIEHFDDFAKGIDDKIDLVGAKVLDIGSNDGTLLNSFIKYGCNVLGIDPAPTVVHEARAKGIETYLGLFSREMAEKVRTKHGKFNLITAFNVFAHSQDMESMLKGVEVLLVENGIFSFEVQYLVDISQKRLLGTFFHEHMLHYSLHSAKEFLKRGDLEIFDFERNNIQNGSIIIHACHKNNFEFQTADNREKVTNQIKYEQVLGLDKPLWAIGFTEDIYKTREEVSNFIKSNSDLEFVGFGAARSGPGLLIQYGLDGRVTKLFDDHPSKVNRFSPYMGLEVRPSRELCPKSNPYCVILAYIHYKPILQNNYEYVSKGGSFILLWPRFVVVNSNNYTDFING
jgi:2-polyprenyl-3-methyl-5-hydroxy-6-metoxy-1,4-benzoquinol methylase